MRISRRLGAVALVLAATLGGCAVFEVLQDDSDDGGAARAVAPSPSVRPSTAPTVSLSATADPQPSCSFDGKAPFVPVSARVGGDASTYTVLPLQRDSQGVPGTPPLTSGGKMSFAWDEPGVRPGAPTGNVLLNAHTYPDGSALGNHLLHTLNRGSQLVVRGADGERLCYRVRERIEVLADDPTAAERVYADGGRPQLVIIVCSGSRLGPGNWTHRTIWFASPERA